MMFHSKQLNYQRVAFFFPLSLSLFLSFSLSLFLSSLHFIATQDFDAATPPDPKVLAEKLEMKDGMGLKQCHKATIWE